MATTTKEAPHPAKDAHSLRLELIGRLEQEGRLDLSEQLRRCGQKVVLRSICCGDARLGMTRCKNKWCPSCARSLAAERSNRLQQVVQTFEWPLFVTLTMRNVDDLKADAVRDLRRAFGRWRRMKDNKAITGGVASVEVTNIGNGWHPHLHMVIDCAWLGPARLRPARWESQEKKAECYRQAKIQMEHTWAKALRQDVAVVHAKRCDAKTIAREVLKYSVKGTDLVNAPENIGSLIDCLKRTRLVTTFGTVHGFKFKASDEGREPCFCNECLEAAAWLPQEVWCSRFGGDRWRVAQVSLATLEQTQHGHGGA